MVSPFYSLIRKAAIALQPSTLLAFHHALVRRGQSVRSVQGGAAVKVPECLTDLEIMHISQSLISLVSPHLVGVVVATLYIMRRRVRLGRRKGTF